MKPAVAVVSEAMSQSKFWVVLPVDWKPLAHCTKQPWPKLTPRQELVFKDTFWKPLIVDKSPQTLRVHVWSSAMVVKSPVARHVTCIGVALAGL